MRKCVIIGLVLAAMVLGSCNLQKGGTIKVENLNSSYSVKIYITKSATDGLGAPPTNAVTSKTIGAGQTGEITIDEDGTYYVRAFFIVATAEIPGTVDPVLPAVLAAGNTVSVKVSFLGS